MDPERSHGSDRSVHPGRAAYFRAPRVAQPTPLWPLLIILAGMLFALFAAAARLALGGL